MKFISGLFKFIALLIMIFVAAALPVSLLMRGLSTLLFSEEAIVSLLEENIFDTEVMAGVAEYYVHEVQNPSGGDSGPIGEMMKTSMRNMSHADWVEVINMIAPPELISETFAQTLNGYYGWIEGPNPVPQIMVNLEPWKRNFSANSLPVIELMLNELPQCTPEQLGRFPDLTADAPQPVEVPMCRPPEPYYSLVLDQVAEVVPRQIQGVPNRVDLGERMQLNQPALQETKQTLLGMRVFMRAALLGVLVLFIVAVPMGARSLPGAFKWAGWPLLAGGGLGLLLGLVMLIFAESLAEGLGGTLFQEVPLPLFEPVSSIAMAWTLFMARYLLVRSAALILFGGGGLVIWGFIRRSGAESPAPSPEVSTLVDVPPQPVTPPPVQPRRGREKDDDSPSGMFG